MLQRFERFNEASFSEEMEIDVLNSISRFYKCIEVSCSRHDVCPTADLVPRMRKEHENMHKWT